MDNKELQDWAHHFQFNKSRFEESSGDFTDKNITGFLEKIFKTRCSTSIDPLIKYYTYLMTCRSMYLMVKTTYYQYLPSSAPETNTEEMALAEMELYSRDVDTLQSSVEAVFPFFFPALAGERSWQIQLGNLDMLIFIYP